LYRFLISIATCPAFFNNFLRELNSYSVPEGDYVGDDEMGGECGTFEGEETDIQGVGWKI
jgi:hypothetical protein